jgi:hypothetical protein
MKTQLKPFRLVPLLMACAVAPAFAADLPSCGDANYDSNPGRQLFTPNVSNASLGIDHPLKSQIVNQQCLLTVVPRDQAMRLASSSSNRHGPGPNGASDLVEGRYVVYLSNGGDGGSGGGARQYDAGGGGGGGGAGAIPVRQEIMLSPGVYKLTLGLGGPGGAMCGGPFGGGPGWGGSPTSMMRISDGQTVAGVQDADSWKRPSRYVNDKLSGRADGHGAAGGPGKTPSGAGGLIGGPIVPVITVSPQAGVAGPSGPIGQPVQPGAEYTTVALNQPGQPGASEQTKRGAEIVGGGGGGAGLGAGGDGAGDAGTRFVDEQPQVGGLGAGGGGGAGGLEVCTAGGPGGNGYIALRPMRPVEVSVITPVQAPPAAVAGPVGPVSAPDYAPPQRPLKQDRN